MTPVPHKYSHHLPLFCAQPLSPSHSLAFLPEQDIDGVDDAADFAAVRSALQDVGVDVTAQHAIFSLLAGMLWLGNIEFLPNEQDNSNDSTHVRAGGLGLRGRVWGRGSRPTSSQVVYGAWAAGLPPHRSR